MSQKDPWIPGSIGIAGVQKFAPAVTFSSFSEEREDVWAKDVSRPYQIIALRGARTDLVGREDIDAMWLESSPDEATVVWDGFEPTALFEVIYECFDPSGAGENFLVRNAETGEACRDERDHVFLSERPIKEGPSKSAGIRHSKALKNWAMSGHHFVTKNIHNPASFEDLEDTNNRRRLWSRMDMSLEKRDRLYGELKDAIDRGDVGSFPARWKFDLERFEREFDLDERKAAGAREADRLFPDVEIPDFPERPSYEREGILKSGFGWLFGNR